MFTKEDYVSFVAIKENLTNTVKIRAIEQLIAIDNWFKDISLAVDDIEFDIDSCKVTLSYEYCGGYQYEHVTLSVENILCNIDTWKVILSNKVKKQEEIIKKEKAQKRINQL